MSDTEVYLVEGDRVVVDLLLWRRYHRHTGTLLERTLDLNPGLADLGLFIPPGIEVTVPVDVPKAETLLPVVSLWD